MQYQVLKPWNIKKEELKETTSNTYHRDTRTQRFDFLRQKRRIYDKKADRKTNCRENVRRTMSWAYKRKCIHRVVGTAKTCIFKHQTIEERTILLFLLFSCSVLSASKRDRWGRKWKNSKLEHKTIFLFFFLLLSLSLLTPANWTCSQHEYIKGPFFWAK